MFLLKLKPLFAERSLTGGDKPSLRSGTAKSAWTKECIHRRQAGGQRWATQLQQSLSLLWAAFKSLLPSWPALTRSACCFFPRWIQLCCAYVKCKVTDLVCCHAHVVCYLSCTTLVASPIWLTQIFAFFRQNQLASGMFQWVKFPRGLTAVWTAVAL